MMATNPKLASLPPVSLDYEAPPPVRYHEQEIFLYQCRNGGTVHPFKTHPIARPACPRGCGTMLQVGHSTVDRPHLNRVVCT